MNKDIKTQVREWLGDRVDALGFAPVDRFGQAPEAHHPSRVLKDARTVVVFGRNVPRGVLNSPDYGRHLLHRSYHTVYPFLDDLALELSNRIESQGFLAAPIGSFAPLVYSDMEPWGVLSLKHAAHLAGLGQFGRTGLMYHPEFGAMLRLGAVVTSAGIEGDPVIEDDPCPEGCTACQQACPSKAFTDGAFNKMTCLAYSIKHAIYPLALRTEEGLKKIERVINTAGHNYRIDCMNCLKVCPIHQRHIK